MFCTAVTGIYSTSLIVDPQQAKILTFSGLFDNIPGTNCKSAHEGLNIQGR